MKLADFDYHLPEELIAQRPLEKRDESRLMLVDRSPGRITHHIFKELPELLTPGDLLVLNNTRVFPARLLGHRRGITSEFHGKKHGPLPAQIEVFLLRPLGGDRWEALVKPGRKMRTGERAYFGKEELECEVLTRRARGIRVLRFFYEGEFEELVDRLGHIPLPPYIHRADETSDLEQYQTIFARKRGAVAAPTAGFHFTPEVFEALKVHGVGWNEITLHVGLGTFQPVQVENIEQHQMHREWFEITPETAAAIQAARLNHRRVAAIGTTVARTLECVAQANSGEILPASGETDIFIFPPYSFQAVDILHTNFHLPQSTLLMLVSAFAGRDLILEAYRQAVELRYRFFSYGDCMLIV